MTLRTKTLLASAALLIVAQAVFYVVSSQTLLRGFAEVEHEAVRENTVRLGKAFESMLGQLDTTTRDWAWWDETYAFATNANADYIHANLTPETLANLNLDLIAFLRPTGHLVYGSALNRNEMTQTALPADFLTHLEPNRLLPLLADPHGSANGILLMSSGPVLVAARHILTSQQAGPPRGTLVMARLLNEEVVGRLSRLVDLPVRMCRLDEIGLRGPAAKAAGLADGPKGIVVQVESRDRIAGYVCLDDIYGRPALVARVDQARTIYAHAQRTLWLFFFTLSGIGLACFAAAIILSERLVILRLGRLKEEVGHIRHGTPSPRRVGVSGHDEVASVARSINAMIEALDRSAEEQLKSESRYRGLVETTPDVVYSLSREGRITSLSPSFQKITAWSRDEWIGRAFQDLVHPDDLPLAVETFQRILRGERPAPYELRIRTKDGAHMTGEFSSSPQVEEGLIVGEFGIARDITARKQAEAEIRELLAQSDRSRMALLSVLEDVRTAENAQRRERDKLKMILDIMPDGVYIVNAQYQVEYVNPAVAKEFGEIRGRACYEYMHGRNKPCPWCRNTEVMAGKAVQWQWEDPCNGKTYDLYDAPLVNADGSVSKIQIFHDVTEHKRVQQALLLSETRFRRLYEESPVGYQSLDVEGRIQDANPAWLRLTGYSREEAVGRWFGDILAPAARTAFPESFERFKATGAMHGIELELACRSGRLLPVSIDGVVAHDDQGAFLRMHCVLHDLTARLLAERQLRESESRQRALLNNIPDIAWLKDTESRFIAVNEPFAKSCGLKPEDIVGKTDLDIWPPELAERYRADDREVIRSAKPKRVEEPLADKQGRMVWIETIKTPIVDNRGEVVGTTGTARDITERKRAEEALRLSEMRFRQLAEMMPETVFETDAEGRLTFVSRKAYESWGYSPEDISRGLNVLDFIAPEQHSIARRNIESRYRGAAGPNEYVGVRKDGSRFPVAIYSEPMFREGRPAGLRGIVIDMTARKEMEEMRIAKEAAERASREKTAFVASMSHELRTPLNTVIGFSEALEDGIYGEVAEKQRSAIQNILASSQHLLQLLSDVLDISRIEAGKSELQVTPVRIGRMIESSLIVIQGRAREHNLRLRLDMPTDIRDLEIKADERRLRQVLLNVLSNAAKFTSDGGTITVSARQRDGEVLISVSDTGIGIKPEERERIFERFYQVVDSAEVKPEGTGLGLAIAREFVNLHGGRIWVESEGKGRGCTVSFTLPLEPGPEGGPDTASPGA